MLESVGSERGMRMGVGVGCGGGQGLVVGGAGLVGVDVVVPVGMLRV